MRTHPGDRFRLFSGALLLLLVLPACRQPEVGLHVTVSGSLQPGVEFDRLSLVAYLAEDRTPLHAATVEGDDLTLPLGFNLVGGPATPEGTVVHVLASAELRGEVVSAARGEGTLLPGAGGLLELVLPPRVVPPEQPAPTETCDDGVDNDDDGLADCADPDCAGAVCGSGGRACSAIEPAGQGEGNPPGLVCGCGAKPLGVWQQPISGFTPRTGASTLRLTTGPRAGWLVVAGGMEAQGPSRRVELFRPGLSQLESVDLAQRRLSPSLVALADGDVLVVGGGGASSDGMERLQFESSSIGVSPPRDFFPPLEVEGATALGDGERVLLTGGTLGERLVALDAPGTSGAWRELSPLSVPRQGAARLLDGRFVLASAARSIDPSLTPASSVDLVELSGPQVQSGPLLPLALVGAAVAETSRGRVLVVGGESAEGPNARAFVVEVQGPAVAVREVRPVPQALAQPRAVSVTGGWVYVLDEATGAAFWFDPAAEAFVRATAAPTPLGMRRVGEALVAMDAQVFHIAGLVMGGTVDGTAHVLEPVCAP